LDILNKKKLMDFAERFENPDLIDVAKKLLNFMKKEK
jgi:hypothetical protein